MRMAACSWLRGEHGAELRRYAPYLIAEVSVQEAKDMRHALNQGFRKVGPMPFSSFRWCEQGASAMA